MSRTVLQFVNDVQDEIGITRSNAVVTATDQQTIQLLGLLNRLGIDLVRKFEWQQLATINVQTTTTAVTVTGDTTSASSVITGMSSTSGLAARQVCTGNGIAPYAEIVTVDSSSQVTLNTPCTATGTTVSLQFSDQDYTLPTDFDRMVSDTNWDRTNHWRNLGPKSMQEWSWIQGGIISTGPRERYMIYNGKLRIFKALTAPINIAYVYVSKNWVNSASTGVRDSNRFSNDGDTCIFPDDLIETGLKFYWFRSKGLDYGAYQDEYQRCLSLRMAQDEPAGALSLAPNPVPLLVGPWSIPDGNWNQ